MVSDDSQDATPRGNRGGAGRPPRRPREAPELEDVLTQLTQEILTLRREAVTQQPAQQPHAEVPEDPAFNWNLLKLPPETRFPVRCTGIVQRVAADLLARLTTLAARDQHDARFVLAVVSEWHDLDDEMKTLAFQRLNIYAIVAAYIASSTAVSATPSNFLLPPGVVPVQRQQNQNQNQQGRRGGRQQRQQQQVQAPAPAPAPAPAAQGRGGRRR